ncbi:MAG: serine/threonine protein kinase [Scytolyngbya sp. HA4215-MV1]|jgi:serine/threonine protein kinase|nr:serine/threonine protein kinase [Scytolyngbya sp. HA4215-MV1]
MVAGQAAHNSVAHWWNTGVETTLAGHYQIVRHLGGGGFGQTFLAKDAHLPGHPFCVVKQLKPKVSDSGTLGTAKRLFNSEANILYRLGVHDQIPALRAHFEQDNEFYLVQDYVEGSTLDTELVVGRQFNELAVILLLQDILQVLAFVHEQKVIHRDIKPANLIRRFRDSKIVLIDFGAVKEVNQVSGLSTDQTSMTVAIGSPGYMPVEQQCFKPQYSSDIYALGIVCIRALTGLHARDIPKDLHSDEFSFNLVKDLVSVSPGLAAILERMVRYDYRQRFSNAQEALKAVQQLTGTVQGKGSQTITHPPVLDDATVPLEFPVTPVKADANSVRSFSQFKDLPSNRKKELERLLAEEIGPIAKVVMHQILNSAVNVQDLLQRLAPHCPENHRAQFLSQIEFLLRDLDSTPSQPTAKSQTSQQTTTSNQVTQAGSTTASPAVDADFAKQCERALANEIGPISALIVQRTIAKRPEISRLQLVESLMQHLPNDQKREAFRKGIRY